MKKQRNVVNCILGHMKIDGLFQKNRLISFTYRKRLQLNLRKKNLHVQKKYLSTWKSHFKMRLDEHRAQQLWSNGCVKKAADKWQMICHRRSLERLLVDSEPVRQLNTQRGKNFVDYVFSPPVTFSSLLRMVIPSFSLNALMLTPENL